MELPVRAPDSGGLEETSNRLQAINVSYRLQSRLCRVLWAPKATSKLILKDVNCEARPGEVTAIAGPSGAGKTTLVEILAGMISPRNVSGQVLVNGRPMDAKLFRKLSGFVTQEDALFPLLTVQETLMYSALLRLPGTGNEAGNQVQRLMKELGLDHVANSRIGDGSKWGISGGERRRVSVGVDLVHDPAVVLIDEPTSGLDSASAFHVLALLKSMAFNQGKTIVLTIHQPGFRILELFDRIVLLSKGHVMHNGSMQALHERLKRAGHRIPRRVNVLEFAIDVIDTLAVETLWSRRRITIQEGPDGGLRALGKRYTYNHIQANLSSARNSLSEEVLILGKRFCSNIFRTKQLFVTRVIQASVAGVVVGTIFLNVGNKTGQMALQTQVGFFAFSLTFLLTSTTEVLPIFLQERRILMKETSTGAYRVSAYVLSNSLIFLPFLAMISLLYSASAYWLVGLRRDIDGFLYFSLVVWMVVLMSNSFVACFSALVPNFIMGTSVISGFIGSFFLFSGYFISKNSIPSYWIFMHYLSLFKYPFESFLLNEFGGEQGRRKCLEFGKPRKCSMYGSDFIRQQGLEDFQKWTNLAVMVSFIVGYRVLCFLILWYRCSRSR